MVGTAFDSKVVSLRRVRKNNLIILQIINEQIHSITTYLPPDPALFVCRLLIFELSNIKWKCSENCNMLTEHFYDSAVFKSFLNIVITCVFIVQFLLCNRNSELLRLVAATFDSKIPSLRRMRKKNLIILKSLAFFVLYICRCWHLSCQISIEIGQKIIICLLNVFI